MLPHSFHGLTVNIFTGCSKDLGNSNIQYDQKSTFILKMDVKNRRLNYDTCKGTFNFTEIFSTFL
jgi:hypothetical protein